MMISERQEMYMDELLSENKKLEAALLETDEALDYCYHNEILNIADYVHAVQIRAMETRTKIQDLVNEIKEQRPNESK